MFWWVVSVDNATKSRSHKYVRNKINIWFFIELSCGALRCANSHGKAITPEWLWLFSQIFRYRQTFQAAARNPCKWKSSCAGVWAPTTTMSTQEGSATQRKHESINIFVIQGNMMLNLSIFLCDMNNLDAHIKRQHNTVAHDVYLSKTWCDFHLRLGNCLSEILRWHLSLTISDWIGKRSRVGLAFAVDSFQQAKMFPFPSSLMYL